MNGAWLSLKGSLFTAAKVALVATAVGGGVALVATPTGVRLLESAGVPLPWRGGEAPTAGEPAATPSAAQPALAGSGAGPAAARAMAGGGRGRSVAPPASSCAGGGCADGKEPGAEGDSEGGEVQAPEGTDGPESGPEGEGAEGTAANEGASTPTVTSTEEVAAEGGNETETETEAVSEAETVTELGTDDVESDRTPPVVTLDGPPERQVTVARLTLSGRAVDAGSGVAEVYLQSSRWSGTTLAADLSGSGVFRAEAALEEGENRLTVTALDRVGNAGTASLTVVRVVDEEDTEGVAGSGEEDSGGESEAASGEESTEEETVAEETEAGDGEATSSEEADITAPLLALDDPGLLPAPQLNRIESGSLTLMGTIVDPHLAGFSVNGEGWGVLPGAETGRYHFSVPLTLPLRTPYAVTLEAWDEAGNRTGRELRFVGGAAVSVEVTAPAEGTERMVDGFLAQVTVTARLAGVLPGDRVAAVGDDRPAVAMTVAGPLAVATLSLAAEPGRHTVTVTVSDAGGEELARDRVALDFVLSEELPLALERSEPANGAAAVEPNQPLTLYFNRPIDPTLLRVTLLETVHGLDYAAGGELVAVDRDREPVALGAAPLPGNRVVMFYPGHDLAYGASAYAEVRYGDDELVRFGYAVRPLPTFLQGVVVDPAGNPLAGVTVRLPESGLSAVSDADGSFAFGFGLPPERRVKPGRQRILFNEGLAAPGIGSLEGWAYVEEGRLNRHGSVRLPLIDDGLPFQRIGGGRAVLAGGALVLDLDGARLRFADGREQGDVQVQFLPLGRFPVSPYPGAVPHWLYAFQPAGVKASGTAAVELAAPPLYGGYDYLPPEGTRVVLVGFDDATLQLLPVGVGRLEGRTVKGAARLSRLDFLGYALVEPDRQPLLERFESGEIGLDGLLAGLGVGT